MSEGERIAKILDELNIHIKGVASDLEKAKKMANKERAFETAQIINTTLDKMLKVQSLVEKLNEVPDLVSVLYWYLGRDL